MNDLSKIILCLCLFMSVGILLTQDVYGEKVETGTVEYRYTPTEGCGYDTETRTMCADGNWSGWNEECASCEGADCCESNQCWNGSVCDNNPDYGSSNKTTTMNSFPPGFTYQSGNYNAEKSWANEGYSFKAQTPILYQKANCKCKKK